MSNYSEFYDVNGFVHMCSYCKCSKDFKTNTLVMVALWISNPPDKVKSFTCSKCEKNIK